MTNILGVLLVGAGAWLTTHARFLAGESCRVIRATRKPQHFHSVDPTSLFCLTLPQIVIFNVATLHELAGIIEEATAILKAARDSGNPVMPVIALSSRIDAVSQKAYVEGFDFLLDGPDAWRKFFENVRGRLDHVNTGIRFLSRHSCPDQQTGLCFAGEEVEEICVETREGGWFTLPFAAAPSTVLDFIARNSSRLRAVTISRLLSKFFASSFHSHSIGRVRNERRWLLTNIMRIRKSLELGLRQARVPINPNYVLESVHCPGKEVLYRFNCIHEIEHKKTAPLVEERS